MEVQCHGRGRCWRTRLRCGAGAAAAWPGRCRRCGRRRRLPVGEAKGQGVDEEAWQPVPGYRPRGGHSATGNPEATEIPREVGPLAAAGIPGCGPRAARDGHRRSGAAFLAVGAAPLPPRRPARQRQRARGAGGLLAPRPALPAPPATHRVRGRPAVRQERRRGGRAGGHGRQPRGALQDCLPHARGGGASLREALPGGGPRGAARRDPPEAKDQCGGGLRGLAEDRRPGGSIGP
mmetsp:Transcript_92980/g.240220  ORF Transcript_92980/g.240220 Transcript_92980/m.240220 type:complete len:235 (-) Transcript_92980:1534-2238(-)